MSTPGDVTKTPLFTTGLARRLELALALAVVALASGAFWSVSNWVLSSWQLR